MLIMVYIIDMQSDSNTVYLHHLLLGKLIRAAESVIITNVAVKQHCIREIFIEILAFLKPIYLQQQAANNKSHSKD